ncbi:hypothetical protein BU17DRAFT_97727 [Hysterangium stoloniferum]|nr:hypothetical protein BU17DRAFT_97727 [Hysterangium stoloniferum]
MNILFKHIKEALWDPCDERGLSPPATGILANSQHVGSEVEQEHSASASGSRENEYNDRGFGVLVPGVSPTIDIVAIHGLDGHRERSWTADNGKLWLRDFLPNCIPHARILTYGYDASTGDEAVTSELTLHSQAQNFLARLSIERGITRTTDRPIIFIAHCLGGIILKCALIQANNATVDHLVEHKWIALSTYGILFLGTPHQGSDTITSARSFSLNSNSEWLQQQLSDYNPISRSFRTVFFYEDIKTVLPDGSTKIIVPQVSAVVPGTVNAQGIGLRKDHSGMSKFASVTDDDFKIVWGVLHDMAVKSPGVITPRWIEFNKKDGGKLTEVVYNARLRPSPRFIGREEYLQRLREFFTRHEPDARWKHFLLHGMGGVGKTQISLKFIEGMLDHYWRIFWIDATSSDTLAASFAGMADDPAAKALDIDKSDMAIINWIKHNENTCLLVFDNADGINMEVQKYLVPLAKKHVLITTRNTPLTNAVTQAIKVEPMSKKDALALLQYPREHSGLSDISKDSMSEEIVKKLGYLPLAVDIAAATIHTGRCISQDYVRIHEKYMSAILKGKDQSMQGALGYNSSVYGALNMSYNIIEQLAKKSEEAADALFLLKILGFFHHQNIMEDIFQKAATAALPKTYDNQLKMTFPDLPANLLECDDEYNRWDNTRLRQGMKVLYDYSLVSTDGVTTQSLSWTLHPIIHLWARYKAKETDALLYIPSARALLVACITPENIMDDVSFHLQLSPHIEAFQEYTTTKVQWDHYDDLAVGFAKVLNACGQWKNAETLLATNMERRREKLGLEHPATLDAMAQLASTYRDLGKWLQAEKLEMEVLRLRKKLLSQDDGTILVAMAQLGHTFRKLGKLTEAESLEIDVFEVRKARFGPKHPDTLEAMSNLASTYTELGKWKEAEELEVVVLTTRQQNLGLEHPYTLVAMDNLANTQHSLGRWKKAEVLKAQVLDVQQKILGPDHPDTLFTMSSLAFTYSELERWQEAEMLEKKVFEVWKRELGTEHQNTLWIMNNLAATYRELGQWDKALALRIDLCTYLGKVMGGEHPNTLQAMGNLASIYRDLGRFEEAKALKIKVMEGMQGKLGNEHPATLRSMANLACSYGDVGEWKKAEKLEIYVLEVQTRLHGPQHPDSLLAMANLTSTQEALKRLDGEV